MDLPDPVQLAVPFFIVALIAEIIWVRIKGAGAGRYEWRDTLTSLAMGTGSLVAGLLTAALLIATALWVAQFHIVALGWALWVWLLCFLLDDLAYYAFHRASHRIRWFWASHVVHHSSRHYNLSTALRQTWTGTISLSFIFRLPLFLIFEPAMVFFVSGANLVYQFWTHTETVKRMPRWFEAVFNTPSHHRVHHASNVQCLDRNYAGMLIIWDRMFGTFQAEVADEVLDYGLVKNIDTYNPLRVALHEWGAIAQDIWRAPSWAVRWHYLAKPPGWRHDGNHDTSDSMRAAWEQAQEK